MQGNQDLIVVVVGVSKAVPVQGMTIYLNNNRRLALFVVLAQEGERVHWNVDKIFD